MFSSTFAPAETKHRQRRQHGFGLVEAVIASALVGIIGLAVLKLIEATSGSSRKVSSSMDLVGIRANIQESVSCAASFPGAGSPPCAAGTYITLRSKNNNVLVAAGGTPFGTWMVRAQCTATGIDLRAASILPAHLTNSAARNFNTTNDSFFRADEVANNLRYSWNHPKARLFSGNSSAGLCQHLFGGSTVVVTCAPNQYLTGINFATNSVECETIPTCPAQTALSWNGSSFACVPARTDDYILNNITRPAIAAALPPAIAAAVPPAVSAEIQNLRNTPFSVITGYRTAGGPIGGNTTFITTVSDSPRWGMACLPPYARVGCWISNSGGGGDFDVRSHGDSGCKTDDEEKSDNATLTISCARLGP